MNKILCAILIVLICLCMPAFASVFSVDTLVYAKSGEEAGTVRVWFSQYEYENEAMREIAKNFTSTTGINIEVIDRRSVFDAPSDLVNYATLDERPDIVFMQAPDIGGLVVSGYLSPLIIEDDLKERFVDAAFDAFSLNGKCYGIGYSIDTSGLIYNKNLISEEELPKNWEEFFTVSEELTVKDASGNYIKRGTLLNSRDMWFTYPIIKEFGGYYFGQLNDGTYNPYDIGLDNEGMLAYVNKIKELKNKGLVLDSQIAGESNIVGEFGKGNVAMMLYGLWSSDYLDNAGIDYGIVPLPKHKDGTVSKPLTTVQGFVINSFSRNISGANAFLKYIMSDVNQQTLIETANGGAAKNGNRNPSNLSVINSDYIQSDDIMRNISKIGEECEPFPNIPEGPIWYNYTTSAFRTIFFGDSNGKPVDAKAKLTELTDAIRKDVALMNYSAERIEIPWWIYLVIGLTAGVFIFLIILRKRFNQKHNPLYVKYDYSKRVTLISWILMVPLLVLLGMFYVYPIIHNVYLSFTDYSGVNLRDYGLVGFANYKDIFTAGLDGLLSMTVWTIIFAFSVVTISFLFGTFIATVLDKVNIKIAKIYRVIFILPWVIPTVITLLMWQGLLETEGGLINQILNLFRIPSVPWLVGKTDYSQSQHCIGYGVVFLPIFYGHRFRNFKINSQGLLRSGKNRWRG